MDFFHDSAKRVANAFEADAALLSLLELLKRRGRHRPEELARLDLAWPVDRVESKQAWLAALEGAERFVRSRPADDVGCP